MPQTEAWHFFFLQEALPDYSYLFTEMDLGAPSRYFCNLPGAFRITCNSTCHTILSPPLYSLLTLELPEGSDTVTVLSWLPSTVFLQSTNISWASTMCQILSWAGGTQWWTSQPFLFILWGCHPNEWKRIIKGSTKYNCRLSSVLRKTETVPQWRKASRASLR